MIFYHPFYQRGEVHLYHRRFNMFRDQRKISNFNLLRECYQTETRWVYWRNKDSFAPARFVLYKDMTFERYKQLRKHVTEEFAVSHLEKMLDMKFSRDIYLEKKLLKRISSFMVATESINTDQWEFILI